MGLEINRLTNAALWVDGKNYLGKVEEVNLPNPKYKMAEHKALGLQSSMEYYSGIDKMEMKFKLNAPYADFARLIGNPTKKYKLMLRGNLESYASGTKVTEKPYVVNVTASPKDFPLGNFKQNDNVELELNFSVFAVKLEIDGEKLFEIDTEANIFVAGGVDIMANYRRNLGI